MDRDLEHPNAILELVIRLEVTGSDYHHDDHAAVEYLLPRSKRLRRVEVSKARSPPHREYTENERMLSSVCSAATEIDPSGRPERAIERNGKEHFGEYPFGGLLIVLFDTADYRLIAIRHR